MKSNQDTEFPPLPLFCYGTAFVRLDGILERAILEEEQPVERSIHYRNPHLPDSPIDRLPAPLIARCVAGIPTREVGKAGNVTRRGMISFFTHIQRLAPRCQMAAHESIQALLNP